MPWRKFLPPHRRCRTHHANHRNSRRRSRPRRWPPRSPRRPRSSRRTSPCRDAVDRRLSRPRGPARECRGRRLLHRGVPPRQPDQGPGAAAQYQRRRGDRREIGQQIPQCGRAVGTRRREAGYSTVRLPSGAVAAQNKLGAATPLRGLEPLQTGLTPYARAGDLPMCSARTDLHTPDRG